MGRGQAAAGGQGISTRLEGEEGNAEERSLNSCVCVDYPKEAKKGGHNFQQKLQLFGGLSFLSRRVSAGGRKPGVTRTGEGGPKEGGKGGDGRRTADFRVRGIFREGG